MKPGLGESQNRVQLGGGGLSAFDFWPEFYLPPTDVFSSPPLCLCAVVGNLTVPGTSVGKLPGACVRTLQGPYKTAICRNFAYASTTPPTMRGKKNGAVRQTLERSSLFYVVL